MRALVVLPTFNEVENIPVVLPRLRDAAPSADVLVVDDGSPDGTADLAESLARDLGSISVLRRPGKAGLGSAYRTGFRRGLDDGYDVLVEMDADLSHDPAVLPTLFKAVEDGADLAIGSRYVPGGSIPEDWGFHRRGLSRWGNRYASAVLGLDVRDATAGFRAYRADALAKIDLSGVRADGYGFQIEMAYRVARNGGRIVEVPITFTDRTRGTSKMSSNIVVEALVLVTWWAIRDRILHRKVRPADRMQGCGSGSSPAG
jgi:dolichol-phosphate mannosyltransferase